VARAARGNHGHSHRPAGHPVSLVTLCGTATEPEPASRPAPLRLNLPGRGSSGYSLREPLAFGGGSTAQPMTAELTWTVNYIRAGEKAPGQRSGCSARALPRASGPAES